MPKKDCRQPWARCPLVFPEFFERSPSRIAVSYPGTAFTTYLISASSGPDPSDGSVRSFPAYQLTIYAIYAIADAERSGGYR